MTIDIAKKCAEEILEEYKGKIAEFGLATKISHIYDTKNFESCEYDSPKLSIVSVNLEIRTKDMKDEDVPQELMVELKELFELADFVKFAKFTASDDDNAKALPTAVRFVTSTYQTELDDEASSNETSGTKETREEE